MSDLEIRPAAAADLPFITEIYEHAVRYGTATFELIPPDLPEMTRRFGVLMSIGQTPAQRPKDTITTRSADVHVRACRRFGRARPRSRPYGSSTESQYK